MNHLKEEKQIRLREDPKLTAVRYGRKGLTGGRSESDEVVWRSWRRHK
jgi:hypothetical protein